MLRFKLAGIPIEVRSDFLIITGLLALSRMGDPVLLVEWIVVVFFSVLLHELGHTLAFKVFGHSPRIELNGMGGLTFPSPGMPLTNGRSIIVSLAGPFAGFAVGGVVTAIAAAFPEHFESPVARQTVADLQWVNIGWGIVNLLPIVPLDGGHVMQSLLRTRMPRPRADRLALQITIGVAAAAAVFALMRGLTFAALMAGYFALTAYRAMAPRER